MASRFAPTIQSAGNALQWAASVTSFRDRLLVVGLAVLVLFLKIPGTFIQPELWAEDALLFTSAYNDGWTSLIEPLGGAYYNSYGTIVAKIAVQFPGSWWPWIGVYGAHCAALLTVFLVTSPRFPLPYKTIAALAVVATPASGDNLLGALANSQWILPLGLVVLLFSRSSGRRPILLLETIFVGVIALEGPLGCFLVPMFIYRTWATSGDERRRLMILTGVLVAGSAVQVAHVAMHPFVFYLIEPHQYDPLLWVITPLRWLDATRVFLRLFDFSFVCAAIAILIGAGVVWFSLQRPYRTLKITMLLFAGTILYSGMLKYRAALYFHGNDRYVYTGSVFFFWFLCIWADTSQRWRNLIIAASAVFIVLGVSKRLKEFRPPAPAPWSEYSSRIGAGPISIPIAPSDFWQVKLSR